MDIFQLENISEERSFTNHTQALSKKRVKTNKSHRHKMIKVYVHQFNTK